MKRSTFFLCLVALLVTTTTVRAAPKGFAFEEAAKGMTTELSHAEQAVDLDSYNQGLSSIKTSGESARELARKAKEGPSEALPPNRHRRLTSSRKYTFNNLVKKLPRQKPENGPGSPEADGRPLRWGQ